MTKNLITVTKTDYYRLTELIQTNIAKKDESPKYLHWLYLELQRALKVDAYTIDPQVVTMNSTVEYRIQGKGSEEVTIVYPDGTFPTRKNIQGIIRSILDPLCIALLGYRTGDSFEWHLPEGKKKITILRVVYQPEAEKKFFL
jgi:regulator of nucleoside diphosphate kinase